MRTWIKKNWGGGISDLLLGIFVMAQLALVFFTQKTVVVNMDGIFSYTLSNNPYTYVFIDDIYEASGMIVGNLPASCYKSGY